LVEFCDRNHFKINDGLKFISKFNKKWFLFYSKCQSKDRSFDRNFTETEISRGFKKNGKKNLFNFFFFKILKFREKILSDCFVLKESNLTLKNDGSNHFGAKNISIVIQFLAFFPPNFQKCLDIFETSTKRLGKKRVKGYYDYQQT